MIEVLVERGVDGVVLSIEARGHSGSQPKGSNVICASVSVLMENLEAGLVLLLKEKVVAKKSDGYHYIKCEVENRGVQLLMESAVLGLRSVQKNYPEEVCVIGD